MQQQWIDEIRKRAAEFWTPEREAHLLGNRAPLLHPVHDAPLWRAMGLMQAFGEITKDDMRKYWQICHIVKLLLPDLQEVNSRHDHPVIVDCGCGRSYLSLLLAWYYRHSLHIEPRVVGIDFNGPIIEQCRRRAAQLDLDDIMTFQSCRLEEAEIPEDTHIFLALHACNTATDWALYYAVKAQAELLAVAPCCQAELAAIWKQYSEEGRAGTLSAIWDSPHLRRHVGAEFTDTMRLLQIRAAGYQASAIEFVPSEHTPKNTLLKGHWCGTPDAAAAAQFLQVKTAAGGAELTLEKLLRGRV